ncbi:hypothetical protein LEGA110927_03375 [Leuconostoc gasicomitatum]|uniref:hypothetical protein n=1 Tax=Leuconostoc gasicomitatum TaxID=115778 RepID=UPI000BCBCE0E|nr:hypothetical protein [Leuconostoc gasicomitatum]MBZ5967258.1 hypothetical protein [Leuconostoc gasicomitatum]QFS15369.1 hypothetical protein BHS03_06880 [Leuconostoc gasicomitatum]SOB97792.1 hypothetical protein LGAA44_100041 [Leuconostoc gasicomitatum]
MSKSGYIVQIKNEYFFLNNITQDDSKAYSYKLEELADTDWVKHYDTKYDNQQYHQRLRDTIIKRISYLYRENVGRFFVLGNHGKMIEI